MLRVSARDDMKSKFNSVSHTSWLERGHSERVVRGGEKGGGEEGGGEEWRGEEWRGEEILRESRCESDGEVISRSLIQSEESLWAI